MDDNATPPNADIIPPDEEMRVVRVAGDAVDIEVAYYMHPHIDLGMVLDLEGFPNVPTAKYEVVDRPAFVTPESHNVDSMFRVSLRRVRVPGGF